MILTHLPMRLGRTYDASSAGSNWRSRGPDLRACDSLTGSSAGFRCRIDRAHDCGSERRNIARQLYYQTPRLHCLRFNDGR
jgi:hypothetical protein